MRSNSDSSRCWSDTKAAFMAPAPLMISSANSPISVISPSTCFLFSISFVNAPR